ncbi:fimbrial protein [uncultured Cedecea sp.]|uniref:fimbrial protein n=1 Tax=uncultured Cedecea sp. TaxID=988762 RepID=UPI0026321EB8|nr:fimbrial protein [uncultured Cedecea sp.]
MFKLNNVRNTLLLIATLCVVGINQAFAAASNCRPTSAGDHIDLFISFEITNDTAVIPPGTTLVSQNSDFIGLTCQFTGPTNNIYFKFAIPESVKSMLNNSGVDIYQRYNLGSVVEHNITLPTVPDILLGSWGQPAVGLDRSFGIRYAFTVRKGVDALKPFDTGIFLLGYHINEAGANIGAPIYARFVGNLTLLCPSPEVYVAASNGGSVNFGTLDPRNLYAGSTVVKNFTVGMAVRPDCATGLNVSIRFEPNNNTVLDNKYLDMGNGLQVLLSNSSGDVNYNEPYFVGELMPYIPLNLPYSATLSHIPGSNIVSGPFSKTIRVVVSY